MQRSNKKRLVKQVRKARPDLELHPTFKGQPVYSVAVPAIPVKLTQTVTTGVVSSVLLVSSASIQDFATRFATLFTEYRIISVVFSVNLFSSTQPGLALSWIEEKDFSAPTAGEAAERGVKRFALGANQMPHHFRWLVSDPFDLQFRDSDSAAQSVAAFKVYSDNATYGSGITAADIGLISASFTFQFRGFSGA